MKEKQTLAEALLEQAGGASPKGLKTRNVAQFLAHKDDISDAMDRGWSMKAIWQMLQQKEQFSGQYNCFTQYVKKYIALHKLNNTDKSRNDQSTENMSSKQSNVAQCTDKQEPNRRMDSAQANGSNSGIVGFQYSSTSDVTKLLDEGE